MIGPMCADLRENHTLELRFTRAINVVGKYSLLIVIISA